VTSKNGFFCRFSRRYLKPWPRPPSLKLDSTVRYYDLGGTHFSGHRSKSTRLLPDTFRVVWISLVSPARRFAGPSKAPCTVSVRVSASIVGLRLQWTSTSFGIGGRLARRARPPGLPSAELRPVSASGRTWRQPDRVALPRPRWAGRYSAEPLRGSPGGELSPRPCSADGLRRPAPLFQFLDPC
jgi:hypothetical protein